MNEPRGYTFDSRDQVAEHQVQGGGMGKAHSSSRCIFYCLASFELGGWERFQSTLNLLQEKNQRSLTSLLSFSTKRLTKINLIFEYLTKEEKSLELRYGFVLLGELTNLSLSSKPSQAEPSPAQPSSKPKSD